MPFSPACHDDHGFRVHDGDAKDDETDDEHDENYGDDSDENADACGIPFLQDGHMLRFLQTPSGIKITGRKVWLLFSF